MDADGCYWMAGVSGWQLYRITPDGQLDLTIDMPIEKPTKPMLAAPISIRFMSLLSAR